jgi:hypothetical protein
MNRGHWLCGLVVALGLVGEARAQFIVPVVPVGYGFGHGGGLGFAFNGAIWR